MPSIYERKTVAGQIGRDGGTAWEDSAIKSDKRKVNNPSAEGKERSVIFMGSYDRVPLLFSLLFRPPPRARRRKEGRRGKAKRLVPEHERGNDGQGVAASVS